MVTTFNAVAFRTRIGKAEIRAGKAVQNSAAMDQRVQKRMDPLDKAMGKAQGTADDALRSALTDKVRAETDMAKCDRSKAEANVRKLSAYVRQLEREGELKAERAEAKAAKASKGPAVWGVRTPDGTTTPIVNADGTFGRLVGRSKRVEMSDATFCFLVGDTCVDLTNDVDGAVIVCNEMVYTVDATSKDGVVILSKVG